MGDRLAGVISDGGEKQHAVSLLNTLPPSPAADERKIAELRNIIHLFFKEKPQRSFSVQGLLETP